MSAFGGKADIVHGPSECPLLTQSGHCRQAFTVPHRGITRLNRFVGTTNNVNQSVISAIDRYTGDVHLLSKTPRLAENDVIRVRCIPHSAYRVKRDSLSPALQKGWAFFRQDYAEIVPTNIAFRLLANVKRLLPARPLLRVKRT